MRSFKMLLLNRISFLTVPMFHLIMRECSVPIMEILFTPNGNFVNPTQ